MGDKETAVDEGRTFDPPKATWGKGPWHREPDDAEWTTRAGLQARTVRSSMGSWCGYVAIMPGHPLWNIGYTQCIEGCRPVTNAELLARGEGSEMLAYRRLLEAHPEWERWECDHPTPERLLRVHGGITYSGVPWGAVAGVPWWFGFDCGHAGDLIPGMERLLDRVHEKGAKREKVRGLHDTYRTLAYVKRECEALAKQLKEYKKPIGMP